jgi:hypothetical protein
MRFELHLRSVRQKLPKISIPLTNGDPDVVVDLQKVFDRCYAAGAYTRQVDYHREPHFALNREDAQWAEALLIKKGFRSTVPE